MTVKAFPTKFEIHDVEIQELIGSVEVFDGGAATVKIDYTLDAKHWIDVQMAVYKALLLCELEGDKV